MISILAAFPKLITRQAFRYFAKFFLSLLLFFRFRKVVSITDYTFGVIRFSGLNASFSLENFELLNKWEFTNRLERIGRFDESLAQRKQLLSYFNTSNPLEMSSSDNYYSYEYGTNIGHAALLAIHQFGQKVGLLPSAHRVLPVFRENTFSKTWLPLLFPSLELSIREGVPIWTELPQNWSRVEKLQLVRRHGDFLDCFSLTEEVFSKFCIDKTSPIISLPAEYLERAQESLCKLGVPSNAPFVAIHVRGGKNVGVRRNQSINSFESTINMIQKKGYWVIRLGDSAMEELPKRPLLLDLTRTPHNDWLHPYILHQARMLLGTNSGPSWMAQIFGTPVLMTNTTSLARSTLSGSKNSLYIPKWVYINDQRMTLRSLLQHTEGYSELDNEALSERNITLVENSPEEILSATLEMFELIETGRTVEPHYGELIDSIRNQASSISFGKFANSVLRMNEWFLD